MDEIFETILKLYGKPGIDSSYLPKLIRNKATGEIRKGCGEPDSSLEEVCWELKGRFVKSSDDYCRSFHAAAEPNKSVTLSINP